MNEKPCSRNEALESALRGAYEKSPEAVLAFFRAFLLGPLFTPERRQTAFSVQNVPYPDEILNVLAVRRNDLIIVPVFSHPEFIEHWSGRNLAWRQMTGAALLRILPNEWHICVNPACEVEKEITPWETARLKHGDTGIQEIVSEISTNEWSQALEIGSIDSGLYKILISSLCNEAHSVREIVFLYLVEELGPTVNGDRTRTILLGIATEDLSAAASKTLQEHFQRILDLHLIGDVPGKVIVGALGGQSVLLNIFSGFEPFYWRSFLSRLRNYFLNRRRANE